MSLELPEISIVIVIKFFLREINTHKISPQKDIYIYIYTYTSIVIVNLE